MLTKKVQWIAQELNEDGDDVLDALLGNITKPREFVQSVAALSLQYDNERNRKLGKDSLGSTSSLQERFSNY